MPKRINERDELKVCGGSFFLRQEGGKRGSSSESLSVTKGTRKIIPPSSENQDYNPVDIFARTRLVEARQMTGYSSTKTHFQNRACFHKYLKDNKHVFEPPFGSKTCSHNCPWTFFVP